jgi:hypothetical protein
MKKLFITLFVIFLVASCKKESVVDLGEFKVTMTKTPTKVGDTAFFSFKGNPDFITFYSGERGRNYDYRNRIIAENSIPQLSFTSFGQGLSALFPNSISLMLSSDYKGDTTTINTATWRDISSRAVFSSGISGTASGTINLSDFRDRDSVYIGFRYKVGSSTTAVQPTWTIQSFSLNSTSLPDSTVHSLRAIGTTGWQTMALANSTNRWQVSSTQLRIAGGPINSSSNESWVITKVSLKSVNPDFGIPIKRIDERVNSYFYRFTRPGVYSLSFLAAGKRIDLDESVVKQFLVTIN